MKVEDAPFPTACSADARTSDALLATVSAAEESDLLAESKNRV